MKRRAEIWTATIMALTMLLLGAAAPAAAALPGIPGGVTATAGNGQATVAFLAPASDSAITSYTVTAAPGGATGYGAAGQITVTGLTNGIPYSFSVAATNSTGMGLLSSASNSVTPFTLPTAPTGVKAVPAGDGQAAVSFALPADNGGSTITRFTVWSVPGNLTTTANSSPVQVNGLTNGTSYTFTVTATNAAGIGPASDASNRVIVLTVPGAPTSVNAAPGSNQATITFSPPANDNSSAITSYTVTSSPGEISATGAGSPIVVTGLSNGTSYTFTVIATNLIGSGSGSAKSAPVTPGIGPTAVLTPENGPGGGIVQGLGNVVIDPTNNRTLYAALSGSGVIKSTDGGNSWNTVNNGLHLLAYLYHVTIDPRNSQTIYAASDLGVYKSSNGGASWVEVTKGLKKSATSWLSAETVAIDPNNSQTIYAGMYYDGVTGDAPAAILKSNDGGASWIPTGLLNHCEIRTIAIDPANSLTVYAGATASYTGEYGAVFKSTDGGSSWTAVLAGNVSSLVIDSNNSQVLYAATPSGGFKSTNGGTSWAKISSTSYGNNFYSSALVIDPSNSQILYAASPPSGIYKSLNGGSSWSAASSGLPAFTVRYLVMDPADSRTMYASGDLGGIYKTTDGGSSWTDVKSAKINRVTSLVQDPSNRQTFFAGTYVGGVHKTTNDGTSWTDANSGLTTAEITALALDLSQTQTIYAATPDGIFKSANGGALWSLIKTLNTLSLAIDATNNKVIYAGTSSGVWKSSDAGASWIAPSQLITEIHSLAIDQTISRTIYAGTNGGVAKSTDGGTTWLAAYQGITTVTSLAIDPTINQTLYAGTPAGVFKSWDGGASWSNTTSGLPVANVTSLVIDPTNSEILYLGTNGNGLFKSTNGGTSWSAVNSALPTRQVYGLALDPSKQSLYAGTPNGVFKSVLSSQLGIIYSGDGSGSVAPLLYTTMNGGLSWYPPGAAVTLSAFPVASSRFAGWSGCDSTNGASCTMTMDSDKNVTATFSVNTFEVTPAAGPGGSINPATTQTIPYGAATSFTIIPNSGFKTATVAGCGGTLSGSTYTTGPAGADCTVQASFIPTCTGTVQDLSTGRPIAAATVAISGGATTQTDAGGNFSFSTPPAAGSLNVIISKTGYGSIVLQVSYSSTSGAAIRTGLVPTSGAPLNFSSAPALPPASLQASYSQALTIAGGSGPYTFNLAYGSLPAGFAPLNTAVGVISGTATVSGSFTFGIGVTDSLGIYAEREFTIDVTPPLTISTAALPRGMTSASYSAALAFSGGAQPYYFSLFSGALPAGLTLDGTRGMLEGTITADPGLYSFAIKVIDSEGRIYSQPFVLSVDPLLTQTTTQLSDAIVGTSHSQTIIATGGLAPYAWSVYAGSLPAAFILDSATGTISGSPTVASSTALTFATTDSDSFTRSVYKAYTFRVLDPLQIPTTTLPNGFVGASYSEPVRVAGGIAPYSFSIVGQLPAGLTINNSTGIVSGNPSVGGFTNVKITATDGTWPTAQSRTVTMGIRVWSQLTITSASIVPNARKGVIITPVTLTARGGTTPYSWSVVANQSGGSTSLPQGVTMDSGTGVMSGTPADTGDFTFSIRVTDASGTPLTVDKQFYLHVSDTLHVVTGSIPAGATGLQYYATLSAAGGLKNYSWTVQSGTLPDGLSLDGSRGVISGNPTGKITSSVTFEVHDRDIPPQSAQQSLVFEINDTLSISETSLLNGREGEAYLSNVRPLLGTPTYAWRMTSGAPPPGITMQVNAGIASFQGTPSTPGSYTFSLEVSDSALQKATRQFTIIIYGPVTVTTTALMNAMRGTAYSDAVAVTGGSEPYLWQVVSGTLPQGLGLNSTTGAITGITDAATGYTASLTVRVTDSGDPAASVNQPYTIRSIDPLVIATSQIAGAQQYSPYSTAFGGQGGIPALSWSVSSASLPTGITLDSASGVMSGTPTVCGSFPVTVMLADSSLVPATVQAAFTLTVACNANGPKTLNVTLAGTGKGAVNSSPSGIACTSGICSADFSNGAVVTLLQASSGGSQFAGWNGDCSGMGNCGVTMNATKSVIAIFNKIPATMIDTTGYDSLNQAYAAASSTVTTTITVLDVKLVESLNMNGGKKIVLKGGYNQDYQTRSGLPTTLQGTLSISSGKLTADRLAVMKP